ncbi:MAG: 2-oxoacid:acceptor oxidoreductase family protein, partial [Deltaproteobacteria bacterium]|nr:2-oxoacid:acceptor oxidoreductase family protein [Deltaproteobacteria bacterium]
GRGGQGVVMASQMLGMAFFKAGMYPQCYSLFGGERRGAPVVSFLRVDRDPILLKCDIKNPDELLYFDQSLLDAEDLSSVAGSGSGILINTPRTEAAIPGLVGFRLGLIDATGIAEEVGLGHVINTTVLGAYCRFNDELPLEHVIRAVEEMVPAKREMNLAALEQGYEKLEIFEPEA